MIDLIKSWFQPMSAEVLAAKMLAQHRVKLLEALEAESYAHAVVAHHRECIVRLEGQQ